MLRSRDIADVVDVALRLFALRLRLMLAFLFRFTATSLLRLTAAFRLPFAATLRRSRAAADVVDAGRVAAVFRCALRSRIRSFLARFRCRTVFRVAAVVDAGRAAFARVADVDRFTRFTAERLRDCVNDRCARAVAGRAEAGRDV